MLSFSRIARLRQVALEPRQFPRNYAHSALVIIGKSDYYGCNHLRTHPSLVRLFDDGSVSACHHAEIDAIRKVPKQLRAKARVFVVRVSRDGRFVLSHPCTYCLTTLSREGIGLRDIFYTDENGEWKCCGGSAAIKSLYSFV